MNEEKKKEKELKPEEKIKQYRLVLKAIQFQRKMGKLEKTHRVKKIKKEIARFLTLNKEVR